MNKSLRIFFFGKIFIFVKIIFLFPSEFFFVINMEDNSSVTLHVKDLAVKIYLYLKDVCIYGWKSSNCSIKYFWSL